MERRLEPELMNDEFQARVYARADFAEPNRLFVTQFRERFPDFRGGLALDIGCGPGDIVLRFARAYPEVVVHGIDGSEAMLRYADNALAHAPGLRTRVHFWHGVLPGALLPVAAYDAVISNSLLHHLHAPTVLWQTIRGCARPGALICVMDLIRPDSEARAKAVVEANALDEPEILKRDFYNSLLAAFTLEEVREQMEAAGLHGLSVETLNDRHWLAWGRLGTH